MNESEIKLGLDKLKKTWEPQGFKCEVYTTDSQELWSNPGHKADEFIILIEGKIEISFSGKTYHPGLGEIFKVPANIAHSFQMRGEPTTKMYWIYAFDWDWNEDGVGIEDGLLRAPTVKSS